MKNLLLCAILGLFITSETSAQLIKGDFVAGIQGNLKYQATKSGSYKGLGLNVENHGLYFVGNNLGIGYVIDFEHSQYKMSNNSLSDLASKNITSQLETGVVLRKYFGSKQLMPFVQLSTGLQYYRTKNFYDGVPSNPYDDYDFFLKPAIGATYWLNDKVGLNAMMDYNLINSNVNELNFKLGISVKLSK
jgi:hypothetical protein